jgi:hypothetical protein
VRPIGIIGKVAGRFTCGIIGQRHKLTNRMGQTRRYEA